MSHIHTEDAQIYYLDQLCTIGLCAALGGVGILMWYQDLLKYILAGQFHLLVLAASVALLGLVAIRAVVLWQAVGQPMHTHSHHHHDSEPDHSHPHPHGHDHEHHHDHDHAHACSHEHHHEQPATSGSHKEEVNAPYYGNNHNHNHEHGWSPWRYMVLLVPFALYLCGLPNQGFSADKWKTHLAQLQPEQTDAQEIADRGGPVLPLEFTELKQAAFLPARREFYEGKWGRLLGQFMPGATPNTCSLIRIKMVCCAADATPLNVIIIAPEKLRDIKPLEWVEVTGQIQFRKRRDRDEFLPVLQIKGADQITPAHPPSNPYL